eukprot:1189064-Prorocentrum_minimum.AAC.2
MGEESRPYKQQSPAKRNFRCMFPPCAEMQPAQPGLRRGSGGGQEGVYLSRWVSDVYVSSFRENAASPARAQEGVRRGSGGGQEGYIYHIGSQTYVPSLRGNAARPLARAQWHFWSHFPGLFQCVNRPSASALCSDPLPPP